MGDPCVGQMKMQRRDESRGERKEGIDGLNEKASMIQGGLIFSGTLFTPHE